MHKYRTYTAEEKIAVVNKWLNGQSLYSLGKELGNKDHSNVKRWIKCYKLYGMNYFLEKNIEFKTAEEEINFLREENALLKQLLINKKKVLFK